MNKTTSKDNNGFPSGDKKPNIMGIFQSRRNFSATESLRKEISEKDNRIKQLEAELEGKKKEVVEANRKLEETERKAEVAEKRGENAEEKLKKIKKDVGLMRENLIQRIRDIAAKVEDSE